MTPFPAFRPSARPPYHRPTIPTRSGSRRRLDIPPVLLTALGCDAVGVPERYGPLVMSGLPRAGCVFAGGKRWWWIVPSESDAEVPWPRLARYAVGALVPVGKRDGPALSADVPRLIHSPQDTTPYTPPIPLYLMVCQIADTTPAW